MPQLTVPTSHVGVAPVVHSTQEQEHPLLSIGNNTAIPAVTLSAKKMSVPNKFRSFLTNQSQFGSIQTLSKLDATQQLRLVENVKNIVSVLGSVPKE